MNIMTRKTIKQIFYFVAKSSGLFYISRFIMRKRLLILGYHGFQLHDEASFRPGLFMRPELFRQRLDYICRSRFSVLPLGEAIERLQNNSLPSNTVVITIDDGFYSVLSKAAPILAERKIPATLYVTSYYVLKGTPIFRLAIQYIFWKTKKKEFPSLPEPWAPPGPVNLGNPQEVKALVWHLINYGETKLNESERQNLFSKVSGILGVKTKDLISSRILTLLKPEELKKLYEFGIQVQLHTHRHRFPKDKLDECNQELIDNVSVLESCLSSDHASLKHFCYPSGEWDQSHWYVLKQHHITTATTCDSGMNSIKTPLLALYRVLDKDDMSWIEFEAELNGFCEIIRYFTGKKKHMERMRKDNRV